MPVTQITIHELVRAATLIEALMYLTTARMASLAVLFGGAVKARDAAKIQTMARGHIYEAALTDAKIARFEGPANYLHSALEALNKGDVKAAEEHAVNGMHHVRNAVKEMAETLTSNGNCVNCECCVCNCATCQPEEE